MQTIYVDVTNLTKIAYLTGIQRVVRSVSIEMYKKIPEKLCFISFDEALSSFQVLDSESFIRFINGGEKERAKIFTGKSIMPVDMKPGDVFFELDAVWNISLKSSVLLPALKHYGVRIAVYIYDVLPINYPQFTHFSTRFNYINYIGSYLQYADAMALIFLARSAERSRLRRPPHHDEVKYGVVEGRGVSLRNISDERRHFLRFHRIHISAAERYLSR